MDIMNNTLTLESLTLAERRAFLWGLLWRSLVITAISGVLGGVSGFLLGLVVDVIAAIRGVESQLIHGISLVLTVIISVAIGVHLL